MTAITTQAIDGKAVRQAQRARALALKLYALGVTCDEADGYDEAQRADVATAANLSTPPSATTWRMTRDELALITQLLSEDS